MPRYHFHLVSDCAEVLDREGIDLADAWTARREAFLVADELVKPGLPAQHRKWQGWSVQVVDESGRDVLFVPVANLLADSPARQRNKEMSVFVADRATNEDPAMGQREQYRSRSGVFSRTLRLTAEAIRHIERCKKLHRAVAMQIGLARDRARRSAQLVDQARTPPAASLPG